MIRPGEAKRTRRALVVDDDSACRRMFDSILKLAVEEVWVAAAGTGTEAIGWLVSSPFDLVLTDLHLPGASGVEVARAAHLLHPSAVIVVATGGGTAQDEEEALAAGASLWLTKPFDVDDLIVYLRTASSRRDQADSNATPSGRAHNRLVTGRR